MPLNENCLEALKVLVLTKSSLVTMLPCYTQRIAALVLSQTHQYLSETAILRLYNYLPSRFPPSSFTKDVLAIFCGYNNYASFCAAQKHISSENPETAP